MVAFLLTTLQNFESVSSVKEYITTLFSHRKLNCQRALTFSQPQPVLFLWKL